MSVGLRDHKLQRNSKEYTPLSSGMRHLILVVFTKPILVIEASFLKLKFLREI